MLHGSLPPHPHVLVSDITPIDSQRATAQRPRSALTQRAHWPPSLQMLHMGWRDPTACFLLMEVCPGGTLKNVLEVRQKRLQPSGLGICSARVRWLVPTCRLQAHGGVLSATDTLQVFFQVAAGVLHVHNSGVLHVSGWRLVSVAA